MKTAFVDTSALVALRDAGDRHHEAAIAWMKNALEEGGLSLVLTNLVLAETHAYFCRTPAAALAYARRLRNDAPFKVVRAEKEDEAAAWTLLDRHRDKTYSFVDAVSFSVMRRLKISSAFAFDDHFRQFGGFAVYP
jgi:predicted nucleic acid-binding protein